MIARWIMMTFVVWLGRCSQFIPRIQVLYVSFRECVLNSLRPLERSFCTSGRHQMSGSSIRLSQWKIPCGASNLQAIEPRAKNSMAYCGDQVVIQWSPFLKLRCCFFMGKLSACWRFFCKESPDFEGPFHNSRSRAAIQFVFLIFWTTVGQSSYDWRNVSIIYK